MSAQPLRVLVAGLGNMGLSHALAYAANPGFEIVGLVNRSTPELQPLRDVKYCHHLMRRSAN
jgi:predicted dehydrogenase